MINEASLTRMLTKLKNGNIAIISACRSECSPSENKSRSNNLRADARQYGFNEILSVWSEIIDGELVQSQETSFLISNIELQDAIALGKKYDQSSILYCDGTNVKEICTTDFEDFEGNERKSGDIVRTMSIEKLNMGLAADIFNRSKPGASSILKKGSNRKAFSFTEALYEVEDHKSSMFRSKPIYKKLYSVLSEATRLNNHMTHIEDLVLLGPDGLNELNSEVEYLIKASQGDKEDKGFNLSQKIDGAPALFIGHKVEGYPDVFVGIKSVLTSPDNAYSSTEEIQAKFGDRPNMAEMMTYGLELANSIPTGELWQGDCLFVKSTRSEREIKGVTYLTFQPNKIIYAYSSENEDYDKVKNSDFGIALHTRYTRSGDKWSQSFRLPQIDVPNNIYTLSPALSMTQASQEVSSTVNKKYEELKKLESQLLSNRDYDALINNKLFMTYWNTFENANLSDRQLVTLDVKTVYNDLVEYIRTKRAKELDTKLSKLKTDAGREKNKIKFDQDSEELEDILMTNKNVLILIVKTLNLAAEIKMQLLSGPLKTKNSYSTFLRRKSTGEYIDSEGEGIALSDAGGNVVKLVDRSTFSSANRDPDIESGFDHNESLGEDYTGFGEEDD